MPFPMTCRVCGGRFTFDPETQPHEVGVYDEPGGKMVECEVSCPRCGNKRWVRFTGNLGLPLS